MTYNEAEILISSSYYLMNHPVVNREGKRSDEYLINLMLIVPNQRVIDVFKLWVANGKDNRVAVDQLGAEVIKDFDIFVCNYIDDKLMAYTLLNNQLN